MALKQKLSLRLKESFLDKKKYAITVKFITYITLCVVGVFMTVLNVINFGFYDVLTFTTGIFSILLVPNILLTLYTVKGVKVADYLFAFELLAMFFMFLYFGKPEGFSAIWIALLPIASMIFYGRTYGSILSGVMLFVLILMFWTPLGDVIKIYDGYTKTFKLRFPILYISFFAVAFFLETIQMRQFEALEKVNKVNADHSTHDQLTGLLNRKGLYDLIEKNSTNYEYEKIGVIIFDLDDFKKINDTYGHVNGDKVLIYFSEVLTSILSKGYACRWGGEEFMVTYFNGVISKSEVEAARRELENHVFEFNDKKVSLTVSCGVFETNDRDNNNKLIWFNKADQALYKAKQTGKNKVVYF